MNGEGGRTFVEKCTVFFDDLDTFGMLYNGRYIALIDRGLAACSTKLGFPLGHEDTPYVIREIQLTFGHPIRRAGEVDLEFRVSRATRSSATFEFVVKSEAGEHVRGHRCVTKFDPAAGR